MYYVCICILYKFQFLAGVGKSASEEAILDEATLLIENIHQENQI